jgi:(S)-ureidoglycine-glyoxylate aminotransferase
MTGDLLPGARILLGPGPTMADPRVLRAMATPLLGQFDPEFTAIMGEVMALSRVVFQTENAFTYPVSGTGRAGLEAAITSLVEPGDRVVVGECGRFGVLLIELAERSGAEVVAVREQWGRVIEPDRIAKALDGGRTRLIAMIHGETSTGAATAARHRARSRASTTRLLADVVVTLGGCEVAVDRWGVDVAVAGTQKCLSCPSGMAPITYNARAAACCARRKSKPRATISISRPARRLLGRRASTTTPRRPRWSMGCGRRCARCKKKGSRRASPVTGSTATRSAPASGRSG